jgi:Protein of unknown function (DUF2997)
MKKIIVIVSPQGQVQVKTEGFGGQGCMEASRRIEEALGATKNVEKTSEYYDQEVVEGMDVCLEN